MNGMSPESALGELRSRWLLILAVMLGSGVGPTVLVPYTAGVFMPALQDEFGWTRGKISFGITLYLAVTALVAPFAGMVADRRGVALMVPVSLAATAIAFALLGMLDGSYAAFLAILAALGIAGAGATTLIMSRIVATGFDRARGTALGLGLLGIGVTSMLAPSILSGVVAAEGWRTAYLAIAVLSLVTLPLVAWPVWRHRRAEPMGAPEREADARQSLGAMLAHPIFRTLAIGFFLIQVSVTGILVHFIPLLIDHGVNPQRAAVFAGMIGAVMIVSRLAVGIVIDRIFAPFVATAVTLAAAFGVGMLAFGGASTAALGACAVGLVIGAEFDLAAYLVSRYFPAHFFGRIYGLLFTVMVVGTMTSTSLYGFWSDWAGGYGQALAAATVALCCAAGLFLTLPRFAVAGHQNIA